MEPGEELGKKGEGKGERGGDKAGERRVSILTYWYSAFASKLSYAFNQVIRACCRDRKLYQKERNKIHSIYCYMQLQNVPYQSGISVTHLVFLVQFTNPPWYTFITHTLIVIRLTIELHCNSKSPSPFSVILLEDHTPPNPLLNSLL